MSWVAVGATVVTAGAGLYSSKKQSDAQKKAAKKGQADIGADIRNYLDAYQEGLPGLLKAEGKYRPAFQGLNQKEISRFLSGSGGLFDLSQTSGKGAASLLNKSRKTDLSNMTGLADETRGFLDALDPQGAAMVKSANQQAQAAQLASKGLTGGEARDAQQFAREAGSDRGRVFDGSTQAQEILNRDSILTGKRQEAANATQSAFNLSNQFYAQPGLQQLNQIPQSYQAGQGLLGIGLSSLGSSTPQLINPDMGVNVGAANRQNQLGAASAAAQSSAAQNAAWMNAGTSIFDSYLKYRGT
jgi:hypothetical protein